MPSSILFFFYSTFLINDHIFVCIFNERLMPEQEFTTGCFFDLVCILVFIIDLERHDFVKKMQIIKQRILEVIR